MLSLTTFPKLNPPDSVMARVESNVAAAINPVLQTPVINGTLLQNLVIPANGKLIAAHGMGRPVLGVHVVLANGPVSVPYLVTAEQVAPNGAAVLTFDTGAGVSVSLWCF